MRILPFALVLTLFACESEPANTPEIDTGAVDQAIDAADEPGDLEAASVTLVNLNTATEDEFKAIPGVGDRMAHEFDEYRPYSSLREFRAEIGKYVDADQVTEYERFVFVPVAYETADAETLMQLPGVGPEEAAALEAGRPYPSADQFLATYAETTGGDLEAARAMLAE